MSDAHTPGGRIKAARKRAHLTQKEMALKVGVSETTANAWERDERLPDTDSLLRLSRALDVSIDYLLLGRRPAGIDRLVGGIEELLDEARGLQAGSATGDDVSSMEPSEPAPVERLRGFTSRPKEKGA